MAKRLFGRTTFKKKLFYYSLVISIVPLLLVGMVSSWISSREVQKEVNNSQRIILKQVQRSVDQTLRSLDKASIQFATQLSVVKLAEVGPLSQYFNETAEMIHTLHLQKNLSDIEYEISLVFNHYDKVYSTRYGLIDVEDFPYQDLIRATPVRYNAGVFVPPGTVPNQKELLLLRPVPIIYGDTANGVIILHLDAARMNSLLSEASLGRDRKLFILDSQGIVIAGQESEDIGEQLATSSELYRFRNQEEGLRSLLTVKNIDYSLSVLKSTTNDWTYVAMVPVRQLERQAVFIRLTTWALVGVIVLIWLFVALIGSNRLYYPIRRLLGKVTDGKEADGLEAIDSFIQKTVHANEQLRLQLGEQLPFVKESFALKLIKGELSSAEMERYAEEHLASQQGSHISVMLVEMDDYHYFQKQYNEKDQSLLMYAFRKMVEEIVADRLRIVLVASTLGQVIVAAEAAGDPLGDSPWTEAAEEILASFREYFAFTVTVSIGARRQGISGISQSYRDAAELLGYRLLLGDNRLITYLDIQPSIQQSELSLVRWQKQIVTYLAHGQQQAAEEMLQEMVKSLPQYIHTSESVRGLFAYLIGELEWLMAESRRENEPLWQDDPYKQLYGMSTLSNITDWLKQTVFPAVIRHLEGMDRNKRMVQQAIIEMKENYQSDLSLQQIADRLNVPHYQLSRAFKEYAGVNFSDYLIQLRMDKAKDWLVQTDMELKEMAERLSYATVQNLSRTFKQFVGIPPGQYRKENRK